MEFMKDYLSIFHGPKLTLKAKKQAVLQATLNLDGTPLTEENKESLKYASLNELINVINNNSKDPLYAVSYTHLTLPTKA